ncbi:uncharacterized protein N7483_004710 [Penicillium malachiteum]|uniref:uncharacterized protein n=1 Tax=Penicillium malachiteum TaxID=1324776 RepID=UPI0025491F6E|nr:uncharacterized protein N7483_004710 [Penicillium malachiteum]KAJ5730202.1 hypothetical protein N7483_004710 [Penicillium malachiteum]
MSTTRLTTLCTRELRGLQVSCLRRPFVQRASLSLATSGTASHNAASGASLKSLDSGLNSRLIISRSNGLTRSVSTGPGAAAETYVAYGMTQRLFEACSNQADYKIPQATQKGVEVPLTKSGEHLGTSDSWWYKGSYSILEMELGLQPTFSTWSQITFLHMYLLTVRLRALPTRDSVQTYSRHLIDHFSHNAEHRMDVLHDIASRSIRNKYLKDLFIQWRGIIAAYDEGLVKGDAVLGAAVWRNLWKADSTGPDGKDIDWTKVAWVVAYMRRVLSELSKMQEADIVMALSKGSSAASGVFGLSPVDKRMAGVDR